MIHDVDETLRKLLEGELAKLPDRQALQNAAIAFELPGQGSGRSVASHGIHLYLHDLRENLKFREQFYVVNRHPDDRNQAGRARAPIQVDLSYLVAVRADGAVEEHQLLSDVLGILLRCNVVPVEYFQGSFANQPAGAIKLEVATAEHPSHVDLVGLWRSLGEPMRPAITLVVSVLFNPFETRWTRVVREVLVGLHPGADPAERTDDYEIGGLRVSAAGMVVSAGHDLPLTGAQIRVANTEFATQTDERGVFFLANLPLGRHLLRITLPGFRSAERQVVVPPPGRPNPLEPLIIELAPLTVDDWQREAQGGEAGAAPMRALMAAHRQMRVTLAGKLAYPDGGPAAGIPLRLGARQTVTDPAGFYQFIDVPMTEEAMVALLPGGEEVAIPVSAAGEGVLDLPPADPAGAKVPVKA